jgi:hypothetical protein
MAHFNCDNVSVACVMNFITHNKAYCLYPYTTFCDCHSIVWDPAKMTAEHMIANKYQGRGWRVDHLILLDDMIKRPTKLGVRKRWVGDSLCWVFDMQMERSDHVEMDEAIRPIMWRIKYSSFPIVSQKGQFLQTENAFRGQIMVEGNLH